MALTDQQLLNIFGDDFQAIIDELDSLGSEVELMLNNVIDNSLFDVDLFANNINRQVLTLSAQGLSEAAIIENLAQDMLEGGVIFGQLRNNVKQSIVKGINESGRIGQYEEYVDKGYGEDSEWRWITVSGHRICPSCRPRGGQVKKYKDWVAEGLPATGALICGGYCYCVLDPVGNMDDEVAIPTDKELREKGA